MLFPPCKFDIKTKITTILLISIILYTLAVELIFVPLMQQHLMNDRQTAVKQLVEVASDILESHLKLSQEGLISSEEAKNRSTFIIRSLRYSNREYFWIHDLTEPVPVMIMHPTVSRLDGKILDDPIFNKASGRFFTPGDTPLKFPDKNLFIAMNETVALNGEGFVSYQWPKPTGDTVTAELYPKVSFVKKFAPWGWVIGSGIYVDDVTTTIGGIKKLIHLASLFFCISVILIYYLLVRYVSRPVAEIALQASNMAEGRYIPVNNIDACGEIGVIATSLEQLSRNVQQKTSELEAVNRDLRMELIEHKQTESERIELERQLFHSQKIESLGIMASGIAHDFNNLLAVIIGNLDLAESHIDKSSVVAKRLDNAKVASLRAADLTTKMLSYSGKGVFEQKPVNLNHLILDNATLFNIAVPAGVTIRTELHDPLPLILGDNAHLQQVIMNLITNAAEAISTENGNITITTGIQDYTRKQLKQSRLLDKPKPGSYVYISVEDSGCGMDDATQRRIFEPFFTTKFTGRGLGMASVSGIIKSHGGAILLESKPEYGSKFTILLPATTNVLNRTDFMDSDQDIISLSDISGCLLIVDDEEQIREICADYIREIGLSTLTAADGFEAVNIYARHKDEIAMVILDLYMPKMGGVATLRELRRMNPDIKVMISSGDSAEASAKYFLIDKPDDFIQKPFRLGDLRKKILALLR